MRNAKQLVNIMAAAALVMVLAACGHSPGERALSGGAIGAGAGAVGGALMGSPLTGAVLGGAAGAAAGGLTSDKQIDLGDPIWE